MPYQDDPVRRSKRRTTKKAQSRQQEGVDTVFPEQHERNRRPREGCSVLPYLETAKVQVAITELAGVKCSSPRSGAFCSRLRRQTEMRATAHRMKNPSPKGDPVSTACGRHRYDPQRYQITPMTISATISRTISTTRTLSTIRMRWCSRGGTTTILEEVVSRLVSATVVLRVAPPAMVVRSVLPAFQAHAPEGMPGLKLVEPCGRSIFRLGYGRASLAFFLEDVARVQLSARNTTRLPATSSPSPCASGALGVVISFIQWTTNFAYRINSLKR